MVNHLQMAKALLLAEENCQSIAPLTDKYPDLSPDDAYQIQLLQIEEKTKKGVNERSNATNVSSK